MQILMQEVGFWSVAFLVQIPKFVMTQVRKQNMERKTNRERAVKKLLKKMAYDRERNSEKVEKNTEVRERAFISHLQKAPPASALYRDFRFSQ